MTDTRVISNKYVEVRVGVDAAIADVKAPKTEELDALLRVNSHMRWDSFDLNVQASQMEEDPTLADEAGSQMRSLLQFGGNASFLVPQSGTNGERAALRDLLIKPNTKLVVAIRGGQLIGDPAATGQVWNVYRVTTDAEQYSRADTGYSYSVNFRPRGDAGINAIVPSATPSAVAFTPASTTLEVGKPVPSKSIYEGNDVTIGAHYVSSDESVFEILPHGWLIPKAPGEAAVRATYPGSAPGTPVAITVA